ncbi:hypothetical protein PLESTB_000558100 [Pleodorina starrii]|uniref:Uncharacterized protein n=1 Tax=Pleodorina starrii TaxID=330485 RepID=A0A9W6BI05_9CHLO|nr:hypothetical protein PLESTM_000283300 [Pleodorina starrii]GLC51876.1 hypothetical protein PLESTB_000558100 [Pleodorina starrii]GLC74557.1 hypothetical protein PLESTF_001526900 [Pleodorina starrii]
MAQAGYPPRDRLSLRAYIRARLRGRGLLEFADDDEETCANTDRVYMNCGQAWHEDALRRTQFELEPLMATSTDNPMQSIGNTVQSDDEFWSSTGSDSAAAGDALLYRLPRTLGRVAYASIAVYRAFYQHGDPLYPPRKVSFLTGPTPNQLYPASPIYPVRLTDEQQVFALAPTAAVSNFLMVRMHGRRQRQWEDLQYYIAIRHVAVYGDPMDPSYSLQIARLVRSAPLAWPCTRGLVSPAATPGEVAGAGLPAGIFGSGRGGSTQGPVAQRRGRAAQEQVLAEDVFEAGPQSAEESLRAYVSAAFRRGSTRALLASQPGTPAAALPRARQGRTWRPRAQLPSGPSGPTESELRLEVQQEGLLRALPHLVCMRWPEILVVRQQQAEWEGEGELRGPGPAATGTGSAAAGPMRQTGRGTTAGPLQGAAAAGAGPSSQRRTLTQHRYGEMSDDAELTSGGGGGSQKAFDDGGGGGRADAGAADVAGAGRLGSVGPLQRLREWVGAMRGARSAGADSDADGAAARPRRRPFGLGAGSSGGSSGRSSSGGGSGSDPRVRRYLAEQAAWAREGPAGPRLRGELSASRPPRAPRPVEGPLARLYALMRGASSDDEDAGGDTAGADASAAAETQPYLRFFLPPSPSHSRPMQALPPPKLRRREDGGPAATGAGSAAAGGKGRGEMAPAAAAAAAAYGRLVGQRRRRHQRAAQRAMQSAVYCPTTSGGTLFVALEEWAGVGGGGAAAREAGGVAVPDGSDAGGNAGCWLVSHYDHEHL